MGSQSIFLYYFSWYFNTDRVWGTRLAWMGKSIFCLDILSNLTNISFKKLTNIPLLFSIKTYLLKFFLSQVSWWLSKISLVYVLPLYFIYGITFTTGYHIMFIFHFPIRNSRIWIFVVLELWLLFLIFPFSWYLAMDWLQERSCFQNHARNDHFDPDFSLCIWSSMVCKLHTVPRRLGGKMSYCRSLWKL